MNRPYIICHILSTLDGKITGAALGTDVAREMSGEYARIRTEYQADAWLYGTVTTKEFTGWWKPELDFGTEVPDGDFVAEAQAALYYVSVDTQGEIISVIRNRHVADLRRRHNQLDVFAAGSRG